MKHSSLLLLEERYVWGLSVRDLYVYFLAVFGMAVGFGYSLYLGDATRFGDEQLYLDLGRHLSEHSIYSKDGIHSTSERPPGYPFFIAGIMNLGGGILAIKLLQFAFFSGSLILVHRILTQWDCGVAGPIAATLVFFYPVIFYTTATIYPQALTTFLFLLVTWLVIAKNIDINRWIIGGLVFGLLAFTTPILLVTLPCLLLAPWILDHKRKLLSVVLFMGITITIITPWIVRNYEVFDRFVFISSNSGLMLILGNSDLAEPNIGPRTDISKYRAVASATTSNTAEYDASLRAQAIEWIQGNKTKALKLYLRKFLNFFNFRNSLASASEEALWKNALMFLTYYPLLLLAVAQMAFGHGGKSRLLEIYMCTCYMLFALFYAIFFTRIRYRLPLDWFVICLAALYLRTRVMSFAAKTSTST